MPPTFYLMGGGTQRLATSWIRVLIVDVTPLIIALQVGTPQVQPAGEPDDPAASAPPSPTTPPPGAPAGPPPGAPPGSTPPTWHPPTWNQPYWQAPPPPVPFQPPAQQRPLAPVKEREVTWWARFELGFGTYGFSESSQLLSEMGYAGLKTWATIDAAWMFHRRVGGGLLVGMNRRSSQPEAAPNLNVTSYFVTAEIPILLGGNRVWAFYLTPRGGYAAADLELDNDVSTDLQHTGTFGGALSFQSFAYHLGSSIGFMHTPTGPLGDAGRSMDFGGLYFTLGTTIDG